MLSIVFSKDRPMQLDAFLRSQRKMASMEMTPGIVEQVIVYCSSHEAYQKGYDIVREQHQNNIWYPETEIKRDLLEIFSRFQEMKTVVFFCDDNIWINKWQWSLMVRECVFENPKILCYSLRMHPEIRRCYPMGNIVTPPPHFVHINETMNWYVWSWQGLRGDWGYPMSIDGHIFRMSDIFPYIMGMPYTNVNEIEMYMSQKPIDRPWMFCAGKSSILNVPLNRVQTTNPNIHMGVDPWQMNQYFLEGKRIIVEVLEGFENVSPHQEADVCIS
jgi:hypothetical protein